MCTPFSNHSNIIENQLGRPVTHILGAELLIGFIDKNAESEPAACIVVQPRGEDEKSMNFSVIISVPERRALYLYNMIHDAKKHLGQHNTSNITCTDCFKLLETVMGISAFSPADFERNARVSDVSRTLRHKSKLEHAMGNSAATRTVAVWWRVKGHEISIRMLFLTFKRPKSSAHNRS